MNRDAAGAAQSAPIFPASVCWFGCAGVMHQSILPEALVEVQSFAPASYSFALAANAKSLGVISVARIIGVNSWAA